MYRHWQLRSLAVFLSCLPGGARQDDECRASLLAGNDCLEYLGEKCPLLSLEQLQRGLVSTAGSFRFKQLHSKLQAREVIGIGLFGGSIEGNGYIEQGQMRWTLWVIEWLKKRFPGLPSPKFRFWWLEGETVFGSASDEGPLIGTTEIEKGEFDEGVQGTYDLVIVALAFNFPLRSQATGNPWHEVHKGEGIFAKAVDINRNYFERLLRAVLSAPGPPAVLFVDWMHNVVLPNDASFEQFSRGMPWGIAQTYRFGTWQDEAHAFLTMYYEVSLVSSRNALLHSVNMRSSAGALLGPHFDPRTFYFDNVHPKLPGHNMYGQLVSFSLCQQFATLQNQTLNQVVPGLPPRVFGNPAWQMYWRRQMDFSGFAHLDPPNTDSCAHPSAALSTPMPPAPPWTPLPSNASNSSDASSGCLNLEIRVTVIPLALLQFFAWRTKMESRHALLPGMEAHHLHTQALELLRFLGVAHIAIFHEGMYRSMGMWQHFAALGKYWVQFFFVLSGFILYVAQKNAPVVSDRGAFVWKRLRELYPAYFVSSVLGVLAAEAPVQVAHKYIMGNIVPGFFLMDSWVWPYGSGAPNGPGWFLCTLFFFWLCFPDWYGLVRVHGLPCLLFSWSATLGIPLVHLAAGCSDQSFAEFHPLANWQTFMFGISLGRVLSESKLIREQQTSMLREWGATGAAIVLCAFAILAPLPGSGAGEIFFDKGPFLLSLFGCLIAGVVIGEDFVLRPGWLDSKLARWLGSMSGSFFLFHWPVRLAVLQLWPDAPVWAVLTTEFFFAASFHELSHSLLGTKRILISELLHENLVSSNARPIESIGVDSSAGEMELQS